MWSEFCAPEGQGEPLQAPGLRLCRAACQRTVFPQMLTRLLSSLKPMEANTTARISFTRQVNIPGAVETDPGVAVRERNSFNSTRQVHQIHSPRTTKVISTRQVHQVHERGLHEKAVEASGRSHSTVNIVCKKKNSIEHHFFVPKEIRAFDPSLPICARHIS